MLKLLQQGIFDCGYIFTCNEQSGMHGAKKTVSDKIYDLYKTNYLYFIEIDRKGVDNLAHYDDMNNAFRQKLEQYTGYKIVPGSVTDICQICSYTNTVGINISAGYYNQHSYNQVTDVQYLKQLPNKVKKLIETIGRNIQFKSQEKTHDSNKYYDYYGGTHKKQNINIIPLSKTKSKQTGYKTINTTRNIQHIAKNDGMLSDIRVSNTQQVIKIIISLPTYIIPINDDIIKIDDFKLKYVKYFYNELIKNIKNKIMFHFDVYN